MILSISTGNLEIYDPIDDVRVPLTMFGSFAAVETRLPSWEEVENCKKLVMSSDSPWHPRDVQEYGKLDYTPPRHFTSISSMISQAHHSAVSPQELAKKWHITQEQAEATFAGTTQYGVRYSRNPLIRCYRIDTAMLSYKRFKDTTFNSDTMHSKVVSLKGFKYLQVFCNEDFVFVVPIKKKSDAGSALQILVQQVGVLSRLMVDGSLEQTADNSEFMRRARMYDIEVRTTEPYTPRQNHAKGVIGILRRKWHHIMAHHLVLPHLWDYAYIYQAEILSRTARGPEQRMYGK
jgi:hypothetical protein